MLILSKNIMTDMHNPWKQPINRNTTPINNLATKIPPLSTFRDNPQQQSNSTIP